MKKRIRVQGALMFFSLVVFVFLAKYMLADWSNPVTARLVGGLGLFLVMGGFLIRIVARGYKEEHSRGGYALVQGGPYLFTRNPMYLGSVSIGTGLILALFNLWLLPVFWIICLLIYLPQVKAEQEILLKRFGREYAQYCRQVPVYLPATLRLFDFRLHIFLLKPAWIKKELPALLITLGVILAMKILQVYKFNARHFMGFIECLVLISVFTGITVILVIIGRKAVS